MFSTFTIDFEMIRNIQFMHKIWQTHVEHTWTHFIFLNKIGHTKSKMSYKYSPFQIILYNLINIVIVSSINAFH